MPTTHSGADDRAPPPADTLKVEVDVTPAMIEAGMEALEFYGGETLYGISDSSLKRLAREVYLAMSLRKGQKQHNGK
jgi:hypothetical protein